MPRGLLRPRSSFRTARSRLTLIRLCEMRAGVAGVVAVDILVRQLPNRTEEPRVGRFLQHPTGPCRVSRASHVGRADTHMWAPCVYMGAAVCAQEALFDCEGGIGVSYVINYGPGGANPSDVVDCAISKYDSECTHTSCHRVLRASSRCACDA